jgi:hypothetical protein
MQALQGDTKGFPDMRPRPSNALTVGNLNALESGYISLVAGSANAFFALVVNAPAQNKVDQCNYRLVHPAP